MGMTADPYRDTHGADIIPAMKPVRPLTCFPNVIMSDEGKTLDDNVVAFHIVQTRLQIAL